MVRVYLTGGLRVEGPSGAFVDADLPGSQGRIALAALVAERRPMSRDALAEIVWDGRLPDSWNGALSAVVSRIRSLVSGVGLDAKAVVSSVGGTYALVLPGGAWVDVEAAHRRLDRADGALRHGDDVTATADGTVAAGILRRPFLAGIDNDWVDAQRRRQQDALHRCSVALATAWLRRGDAGLAATIAESAVALDPLREVGHRLVMQAELSRGDRAAAARALTRCEQVLRDELGVAPSPETAELAAAIRS